MDLINTENIFAWGTLIAYFTHGIITGWSYSLCFKVKATKPVYMAIMIMATAVLLSATQNAKSGKPRDKPK
jgi:hypothetical protein